MADERDRAPRLPRDKKRTECVPGSKGRLLVISSIEAEGRTVKLNQVSFDVPNIFDIDSVSLVIGNNGSGKTYFLNRIVDKFTPKAKDDKFSCEIYLDSGKRMSYQEMRGKWGAIYYSPIPYGRRLHRCRNLIDASPNWGKPLSVFDLRTHEDILQEFEISPKVYAKKTVDVRKVCKTIVNILILQEYPSIESEVLRKAGRRLIEFLDHRKKNEKSKGDIDLSIFVLEKTEQKLLEQVAGDVYGVLMDIIDDHVEAFCFFAVLEKHITKGRRVGPLVRSFVMDVLRRKHMDVPYVRQAEDQDAFEEVHSAVEFLAQHPTEITMDSRSKMEAELNGYDRSPLGEWGLDELFEIGFQDMSSGQMAVLAQLSLISDAVKVFSERKIKRLLVLIDEGDAFLHLEWQRKYIDHLNTMLLRLQNVYGMTSIQVVLATHSPLLATDVPKEFICRMESAHDGQAPSAFAAPLHELLNQSFGAKTVGAFASRKINEVIASLTTGQISDTERFIVSSIDNPIIKSEVERRIKREGIVL